jgi:hypothetical protein
MVMVWVATTASATLLAVTVMVWRPIAGQVKLTLIWGSGICSVACHARVMGWVVVDGVIDGRVDVMGVGNDERLADAGVALAGSRVLVGPAVDATAAPPAVASTSESELRRG